MAKKGAVRAWLSQLNDSHEKFGSKEWFKAYGLVILGTFIFVVGDIMFANPYHLAPGGTYGLSNVLNALIPWKLSFYVFCLDFPLLVIGLIVLGPRFGVKTLLSVFLGYIFTFILETTWGYAPLIHVGNMISDVSANLQEGTVLQIGETARYFFPDYMLNTLVAGLVYGVGIGLIFKAGGTSGGSDIISMIINKYTHLPIATLIIIVDGCIALSSFLIAGDIRFPIYSIILIFVEGKVIDFIVDTKTNRVMFIVTNRTEEVKDLILNKIGRSGTVFTGKGLYKGEERDMIYTSVTRKEYLKIKFSIKKIDPKAFINVVSNTETLGEGFDRLPNEGDINL